VTVFATCFIICTLFVYVRDSIKNARARARVSYTHRKIVPVKIDQLRRSFMIVSIINDICKADVKENASRDAIKHDNEVRLH